MRRTTASLLGLAIGLTLSACVDTAAVGVPPLPDATVDASGDASSDVAPDGTTVSDGTPVVRRLTVTGLAPARGLTDGGEELVLSGTALRDIVEIRFGETAAEGWRTDSDTRGIVTTPARPPGLVNLVLTDLNGAELVLESAFVFESPVTLATVEPDRGHLRGGQPLRITGAGLTADSVVLLGDRRALQVSLEADGSLRALTPEGTGPGLVDLHVSTRTGQGTLRDAFTWLAAPELSGVAPNSGPADAPTPITLVGLYLDRAETFDVGGLPLLDVQRISETEVRGLVPPTTLPRTADVRATGPDGEAVAQGAFTWLPADPGPDLSLVALWPDTAPLAGGGVVSMVVTGLSDALVADSSVTVRFGEAPAEVLQASPLANLVVVRVPAATAAGTVDVSVSVGASAAVLTEAFDYRASPRVFDVLPNAGPDTGGTRVTIRGEGFTPEATVRIGPLFAADVVFVDAGRLEATTPAGSPGLARVSVTQLGGSDVLVGGFLYDGAPAVWAADPGSGSIAGGTLLTVMGRGFEAGAKVRFDGALGTEVQVLSPTRLEVRTPQGPPGRTDISVQVPGQPEATGRGLYLYFDPTGQDGFWGGPIDRNINITVFDRFARQPLAGAFVVIGQSTQTQLRGYTNAAGQLTLGARDLAGPLMLTANARDYQISSLVGVNSTNVTLGVDPIPVCADVVEDIPCSQPPGPAAGVTGQASGNFKGVKIPWGQCEDVVAEPGGICQACEVDADCGGRPCVDIPEQGRFCTAPCTSAADCPSEFGCFDLGGKVGLACVPSGGEIRTYCDITNPSPGSQDTIPFPGVQVGPDGTFDFPTGLGDFAVFCWTGLWRAGQFTPERLGIARGSGAFEAGQLVVADIDIHHPINRDVTILLDRPAMGPVETESTSLRIFLDLGGEGVLEFPPLATLGRGALNTTLLHDLTEELSGTSYLMIAEVRMSLEPLGRSVTQASDITTINSDLAYRLDGADGLGWQPRPAFPNTAHAVSGGDGTLLAVGARGLIARNTGGDWWALQPSNTVRDLNGVHSLPSGFAIAVGAGATALHYDGLVWNPVAVPLEPQATLTAVHVEAPDLAFAVADQRVLAWDGVAWTLAATLEQPLHAVTTDAAGRLWVAGTNGYLAVDAGQGFEPVDTATTAALTSLWASPEGALYVAGEFGTLLRLTDGDPDAGLLISDESGATHRKLHAIWGRSDTEVYAVGAGGTIVRRGADGWQDTTPRDFQSTLFAVGGTPETAWTLGAHELVLGPMLAIPRNISPGDNQQLFHHIEWFAEQSYPADFTRITVGTQTPPCSACGFTFAIPYDQRNVILEGSLTSVTLPNLAGVPDTTPANSGLRSLSIRRAYTGPTFDFDTARSPQFYGAGWRSYSENFATVF